MHAHVVQACNAMYRRIARTQGFSSLLCNQAEEALNYLLKNPDRSDPPAYLVRSATDFAKRKIRQRWVAETLYFPTLETGADRVIEHTIAENALDIEAVLSRMSPAERTLLELAANGSEADEIAAKVNLPVLRVREKLSRARARARALRMGAAS